MTGPDDQRWVLLEPPTAVSRFWRRALALAAPALVVVLIAFPPEVVAQRSTEQWVVQGVALLAAITGGCWVWVTASTAREITGEVNRILAWRPSRQYRRLERALHRGEPITGTDRCLAAAYVASQQAHLHQPGGIQLGTGIMLTALADNHTGFWAWAIAAVALAANLSLVLVADHARRLWRAATRAGVAPQVADTPPPSPRIPRLKPLTSALRTMGCRCGFGSCWEPALSRRTHLGLSGLPEARRRGSAYGVERSQRDALGACYWVRSCPPPTADRRTLWINGPSGAARRRGGQDQQQQSRRHRNGHEQAHRDDFQRATCSDRCEPSDEEKRRPE